MTLLQITYTKAKSYCKATNLNQDQPECSQAQRLSYQRELSASLLLLVAFLSFFFFK